METKFILTDDRKPLFALGEARGPSHGPLEEPVRVNMDILQKLLLQKDRPCAIYEVVQIGITPNHEPIFSNRVQLTLENYTNSWYTISGVPEPGDDSPDPTKTIIYKDGKRSYMPSGQNKILLINCSGANPIFNDYSEKGYIGDKPVDIADRSNGRMIIYDEVSGKHVYVDVPTSGGEIEGAYVRTLNGQSGDIVLSIPTKVSQLENDEVYLTAVPTADASTIGGILASPKGDIDTVEIKIDPTTHKLYCPEGSFEGSYVETINGQSGSVILNIPVKLSDLDNDSSFLTDIPVADASTIGGIIASPKTVDDTIEAKIDPTSHKLYITIPQQTFTELGLIGDKEVDVANRADGYVPVFNSATDKHEYQKLPTSLSDLSDGSNVLTSIPMATDIVLGGIKANIKTENETNPVTIDPATGFLYTASSAGASLSGKKIVTFVIGTTASSHTIDDCDYLCDGVDDQVEINAALAAIPDIGGEILILSGTYNLSATLTFGKSNTTLRGSGSSTILKAAISIDPAITVDKEYTVLRDMVLDGNSNAAPSRAILINSTQHITIDSMSFFNFVNSETIHIVTACGYVNILNNYFLNNKNSIYFFINSSNAIHNINISQNFFKNPSNHSICIKGNYKEIIVCGNQIISDSFLSSGAIFITGNDILYSATEILISNNIISNFYYGIFASFNNGANPKIHISGNIISQCSQGISLANYVSNALIVGNQIINSIEIAIYLSSGCNNNNITANLCIRGTGLTTDYSASQYSLQITSGTSNNLATSNMIMGKAAMVGGTGNTLVNNKSS